MSTEDENKKRGRTRSHSCEGKKKERRKLCIPKKSGRMGNQTLAATVPKT